MKNIPPDFILIGAAKCGTTAMVEVLRKHPGVYWSPVKEPHYFSGFDINNFSGDFRRNNVINTTAYFLNRRLPEQFQIFVKKRSNYFRLFENAAKGVMRGEASTSYLYSKEAPKAIVKHNPDIKLVAILRNPVDRVFSHYAMAMKYGYTTDDFLTAIKKDQDNEQKGWGQSELFLELGHYDEQIERYFQYFDRRQIHIVIYEEWKTEPEKIMGELTDFLGIPHINGLESETHNAGELPRFAKINRIFHRLGLRQYLADKMPSRIKERLRSLYLKPKEEWTMDSQTRDFLEKYYKPRINKLETILKRDLEIWKY